MVAPVAASNHAYNAPPVSDHLMPGLWQNVGLDVGKDKVEGYHGTLADPGMGGPGVPHVRS